MTTTQVCSTAQHATLSTTVDELIKFRSVQTLTLGGSPGAGDSFQLTYADPPSTLTTFVVGTNCTAAALQSYLRTQTGDASLTVSGTTDQGPFTITFVALLGARMTIGAYPIVTAGGLTTTTVSNSLEQMHDSVRVTNRDNSVTMYFSINSSTVPTSAADDVYEVLPGTSVVAMSPGGGEIQTIRVVGNGNAYSVDAF